MDIKIIPATADFSESVHLILDQCVEVYHDMQAEQAGHAGDPTFVPSSYYRLQGLEMALAAILSMEATDAGALVRAACQG
jgi:hypothetical protein